MPFEFDSASDQTLLLTRIRGGDPHAFDAVFKAFYPGLCGFTASYVGSPQVAEELVQEVFFDLWQRRGALDPEATMKPFLYRAAKNQALKYLRHQRVEDRSRGHIVAMLQRAPQTPEERFRYNELSQVIQRCIDGLPERCRQIFLLSRKSGFSYAEIADLLEISIKTVETQMGRALKAIRVKIDTDLT